MRNKANRYLRRNKNEGQQQQQEVEDLKRHCQGIHENV